MSAESGGPAESDRYGRERALERWGARLGRLIGDGWLRRVLRTVFRHVLAWSNGGGLTSRLPHGEVVRVAPEFRFVTWNPVEYEAFRLVLRPGDVAFDIGANVGAYTVLFAQWVGAAGKVHAFEPAPDAFRGLQRHIELNHLDEIVVARRVAVSDQIGEAGFVGTGSEGTNHLLSQSESEARVIRVSTTTVDAVCAESGVCPRLLKIDVEGAELAVLRGARHTIARMDRAAGIFVEMHPAAWRVQGLTVDAIRAELAAQGLRAVALRDTDEPWAIEGECMRLVPL